MSRRILPIEVRARLRRILTSRFVAAHPSVPFMAPTREPASFVVAHTDPTDGRWRVSTFDPRGASGHSYASDYREAVQLASREFVADLSRAEFPSWVQP